ncbi:hypothetical protein BGZ61DRAFT_532971 [Ilyonectria robusta]|uniref:uncharacterized protein n=1 Tax=Ilyonectria robusta TaxID=1079257 RepID=UPI001E8CB831|nr:uncharacterized protein BGZ61DRAFT_532971 [Ilyonectria robusta]KAH8688157.1 hypothetical protein BGZ61DRAFT_532971 [Ilyonectria robusta]
MSSNQPNEGHKQPLNDPMAGFLGDEDSIPDDTDYSECSDESEESNPDPWIPHDPFLSDVRRIQWPKVLMPPKNAKEGCWDHVRYAPAWTDPDWEDNGPGRDDLDYPIKNGLMSQVRPALLAKDQIQNPTQYAKRFGIFPGRVDGRSRTSPTRAESRQVFPSGDVRTGKQVFIRLEELAAEKGYSLDDFMAQKGIDTSNMRETDEACIRVYEELLVDEYWQGIIFGDLTMDELRAEDYFTMGDAESNLKGPLHPLLDRSRWVNTRWLGFEETEPRTAYNINGERGEYDPRKNDRVWDAMQPALQLASRLLRADDPFLSAVKDVTNRFRIDDTLDRRPIEEREETPRFQFRRFVDMNDPDLVPAAKRMRQYPNFNASAFTEAALERCLQLNIRSGHYHFGTRFFENAPAGVTAGSALEDPNAPIRISICAELVWPLLEPNFSTSEKLMASFILATTIVHELMHGWGISHYKWLYSPDAYGISDPVLQGICDELREELYPGGKWSMSMEPSFEEDSVSELGHAYEQHVLGGGSWSLSSNMSLRAGPSLLGDYSGLAIHVNWPDGTPDAMLHVLSEPKPRSEQYAHFLRINDVQQYFTEEFWQISVKKYGMAAMRNPSKKPHKIFFAPETCRTSAALFRESGLGPREVREWIVNYLYTLNQQGKSTLNTYLRTLVSEACNFGLMTKRFLKDKKTRTATEWLWLKTTKFALMLVLELRGHVIGLSNSSEEKKLASFNKEYSRWMQLATSAGAWPDERSQRCHGGVYTFRQSVSNISINDHNDRIIPKLMDLVNYLEAEREHQESMLCELYKLPSQFWVHYKRGFESHYKFWKDQTTLILRSLSTIMQMANDIRACFPPWDGEWRARLQSLATAFTNIQRLLEMDNKKVGENWHDLLVTVPMLRKCRRQAHQRLFPFAKQEMLNLTGEDLENLKEFKKQLDIMVNLESYKIVLPETDVDEQGLMQRWAGLLDDVMEKKSSGSKLASVFDTRPVQGLAGKLKQQELEAEKNKWDRAAEQAAKNTKKARQKQKGPTLQQRAESQALQVPQVTPQITQPYVQSAAVPFGGFQAAQFGQTSQMSSSTPGLGTTSHGFGPYASGSSLFPSQKEGEKAPWTANNPADQAAQVNEGDKSKPYKTQPIGSIMPHPFAIRSTITKDLLNVVSEKLESSAVGSFEQDGPREGESILGRPGPQGDGELGNMDDAWEQQDVEMEGVEYDDEGQEENGDVLDKWLQGEKRNEEEQAAARDRDANKGHNGMNFPPGAAFVAKLMWDDDDTVSTSSVASSPATQESNDTTAVESDGSSGLETDGGSGLDTEVADVKSAGLKRKRSCVAAGETKRAKLDGNKREGKTWWKVVAEAWRLR